MSCSRAVLFTLFISCGLNPSTLMFRIGPRACLVALSMYVPTSLDLYRRHSRWPTLACLYFMLSFCSPRPSYFSSLMVRPQPLVRGAGYRILSHPISPACLDTTTPHIPHGSDTTISPPHAHHTCLSLRFITRTYMMTIRYFITEETFSCTYS